MALKATTKKLKKISQAGLDLLKTLEGFSSKKYLDTAGLPTIGYGTLIDEKDEQWLNTAKISRETGEALLRKDVAKFEPVINSALKTEVNQYQFDALLCFCYNVGDQGFKTSKLLKIVNLDPNDPEIKEQFMRWNKEKKFVKGVLTAVDNKGLTNRRQLEAALYFNKE